MAERRKNRKSLVIGLGNLLGGDDGFGCRVIQHLRQQALQSFEHADLVEAHTDLLGHMDRFAHYEQVVLVDAILDPRQKFGGLGHVVALEEAGFGALTETSPSAHQVSPLLAVRLFRRLHPDAGTSIFLVALCTDKISMGYEAEVPTGYLTDAAVEEGARQVLSLI